MSAGTTGAAGAGGPSGTVPGVTDHVDGVEGLGLRDRAQWRGVLQTPFRNLFYANVTSSLGDWIGVVAILALTQQILGTTRGAALGMAGIMIARVVPAMLLGPVAGVYVDRWDRRRVLIATDIGRGLIMALVPFSPDVWALLLATLLIEVQSALFMPAKDSMIPRLAGRERLVPANQLNLIAAYGTFPLGGLFFAVLVAGSGALFDVPFLDDRPAAVAIWVNALTFFVSAVFVMRIPQVDNGDEKIAAGARPGAWQELKEGFRFIADNALVRGLVTGVMAAALAAGVVIAIGQLFAVILNAGDSGFGILVAVVGTGLFLGILAVGRLTRRLETEQLFAPGIAVAGVSLAVAALMPRLDLASIPAFVMGLGAGVAFLTGYTILQDRTADSVRGRTFAAFNTGVRAAIFAALIAGPLFVVAIGPEAEGLISEEDGVVGEGPVEPGEVTGPIPYSIGGIRLSLIIAGLVAVGGAIYSGRGIHAVLSGRSDLDLGEVAGAGPRPSRGLFVTFEGGDGSGKSTQVQLLRAAVERAGLDATVTREPGGTAIGERLRAVVLDPDASLMADRAEALIYAAARAQHVEEVIRPALDKGHVVLCDRYVDSSVVYQGVGRGLGEPQVAELNRWATAELVPDLVVVLDIDAAEGLRRRGEAPDRLEAAGADFHDVVNAAYRELATQDPARYLVLDASVPAEQLHATIRDVVMARLGEGDPGHVPPTEPIDVERRHRPGEEHP